MLRRTGKRFPFMLMCFSVDGEFSQAQDSQSSWESRAGQDAHPARYCPDLSTKSYCVTAQKQSKKTHIFFRFLFNMTTVQLMNYITNISSETTGCAFRDRSRAVTASDPNETKASPTGWQPEREDRPKTRAHGAGGEEHHTCGFHPEAGHHRW